MREHKNVRPAESEKTAPENTLLIRVHEPNQVIEALSEIYMQVPGEVVRELETRRVLIEWQPVAHLSIVHDLLAPYRLFARWCAIMGFNEDVVKGMIYRYKQRQGVIAPPPARQQASRMLSWRLRNLLLSEYFDELWDGKFERWAANFLYANPDTDVRTRMLRLSRFLRDIVKTHAEVSEHAETVTHE